MTGRAGRQTAVGGRSLYRLRAGGVGVLAGLLAGADPPVAVAGGPAAVVLADAVAGAVLVRDAREGVVLALPRAQPRLHHAPMLVIGRKQ